MLSAVVHSIRQKREVEVGGQTGRFKGTDQMSRKRELSEGRGLVKREVGMRGVI